MEHMSFAKGISWFDDCRIPFTDGGWGTRHNKEYPEWKGSKNFTHPEQILSQNTIGRFPANILVSDDMLNDGSTTKGSGHKIPKRTNNSKNVLDLKTYHRDAAYEDKGTNSRYYDIDKWFDNLLESCE